MNHKFQSASFDTLVCGMNINTDGDPNVRVPCCLPASADCHMPEKSQTEGYLDSIREQGEQAPKYADEICESCYEVGVQQGRVGVRLCPLHRSAPSLVTQLGEALEPFANLLHGNLDDIGGGTLIAPTIKVQLIKNARAALAEYEKVKLKK